MVEILEPNREGVGVLRPRPDMNARDVDDWFVREVLPLEAALMQFLNHNWRNKSEIADLRQDIYERVCEAAQEQLPHNTKPFVFTTARNLLIDRVREKRFVLLDTVAKLEALDIASNEPGAERVVIAREELQRLQAALDCLPRQCRKTVVMAKIDGLSRREIAVRMGVSEETVKMHLANGMRALADALYSVPANPERSA